MNVTKTAEVGKVNAETIFEFKQTGTTVIAEYSGGKIEYGRLVGKLIEDKLEFRYSQIDTEGNLDGGHSFCDLLTTPNGKIELHENFTWESMEGSGVNIFEEI
jgi:hypothetical protein